MQAVQVGAVQVTGGDAQNVIAVVKEETIPVGVAVKLKAAHFPAATVVEIADEKVGVVEPDQLDSALGGERGDLGGGTEILRPLHRVLALAGFIGGAVDQPGQVDGRTMLRAELVDADAGGPDKVPPVAVVLVLGHPVFLPVAQGRASAGDHVFLLRVVALRTGRIRNGGEAEQGQQDQSEESTGGHRRG